MPRYFSSAATGIRATDIIGRVLDRAPRPYSAGEIAEITGLPITIVTSFLTRNQARGRISVRIVPRRGSDSGTPMREYWRGNDCIYHTFGKGDMLSQDQARELAQGRRPVQWRETASTVWSVDETDTLAVRRGEQVICMGKVQSIKETRAGRVAITVRNGPRLEFSTQERKQA